MGSSVLALHRESHYVFAGKVGTGFDQCSRSKPAKMLEERHADVPTATGVPGLGGQVRWARPGLLAEIRFSE